MAYYSLPTGKLYKEEKIRKWKNLPKNFEADQNRLDDIDGEFESNFHKKN